MVASTGFTYDVGSLAESLCNSPCAEVALSEHKLITTFQVVYRVNLVQVGAKVSRCCDGSRSNKSRT